LDFWKASKRMGRGKSTSEVGWDRTPKKTPEWGKTKQPKPGGRKEMPADCSAGALLGENALCGSESFLRKFATGGGTYSKCENRMSQAGKGGEKEGDRITAGK